MAEQPATTIAEIADRIHRSTGLPVETASVVLRGLVTELQGDLKRFRSAALPGLAAFRVEVSSPTAERQGINPFTKQPMVLPAKPGAVAVRARPDPELRRLATEWADSGELGPPPDPTRYQDVQE